MAKSATSSTPMMLTAEQAARELGIGRTRVFALIAAGDIRSVKIGASRRIPRTEVARYIEQLLAAASDQAVA